MAKRLSTHAHGRKNVISSHLGRDSSRVWDGHVYTAIFEMDNRQAPLSTGFSRQEYWSELPFPSPGDLPDEGIEPRSPALQAASLLIELPRKSG